MRVPTGLERSGALPYIHALAGWINAHARRLDIGGKYIGGGFLFNFGIGNPEEK